MKNSPTLQQLQKQHQDSMISSSQIRCDEREWIYILAFVAIACVAVFEDWFYILASVAIFSRWSQNGKISAIPTNGVSIGSSGNFLLTERAKVNIRMPWTLAKRPRGPAAVMPTWQGTWMTGAWLPKRWSRQLVRQQETKSSTAFCHEEEHNIFQELQSEQRGCRQRAKHSR
jgi:hypothetical protein